MVDIDRQNLAATKLQGIMQDLNMNTQQFATAISILYGESTTIVERMRRYLWPAGYIPFQLPSNYIISKLSRPGLCELLPLPSSI
jgi:hypothetical protein